MAEYKDRDAFPEVSDTKVTLGDYGGDSRLAVNDIYSPKEEPILRDNIMDPVKPKEANDYNSRIFSQQPEIILSGDSVKTEGQLINMINAFQKDDMPKLGGGRNTKVDKRKTKVHNVSGRGLVQQNVERVNQDKAASTDVAKGSTEIELLDTVIAVISKTTNESESLSLIDNFLGT